MATVSYQYKVVKPEFTMHSAIGDQTQPDLAITSNGDIHLINLSPGSGGALEFNLSRFISDGTRISSSLLGCGLISAQP